MYITSRSQSVTMYHIVSCPTTSGTNLVAPLCTFWEPGCSSLTHCVEVDHSYDPDGQGQSSPPGRRPWTATEGGDSFSTSRRPQTCTRAGRLCRLCPSPELGWGTPPAPPATGDKVKWVSPTPGYTSLLYWSIYSKTVSATSTLTVHQGTVLSHSPQGLRIGFLPSLYLGIRCEDSLAILQWYNLWLLLDLPYLDPSS